MWRNLDQRLRSHEIMDGPDLDQTSHRQALAGLARLNRLSGASTHLWSRIQSMHARWALSDTSAVRTHFRVMDLACGSGDVTRALATKAVHLAAPMAWLGVDASMVAVDEARSLAAHRGTPAQEVEFQVLDVLRDDLPRGYDLCTIGLFLHHLSTQEAVDLMRRVAEVCPRLIVSDLDRTWLSRCLVNAAARLVTRSPVVHHDADASVCAAFRPDEFEQMAQRAGLAGARVRRVFPCRLLLEWEDQR